MASREPTFPFFDESFPFFHALDETNVEAYFALSNFYDRNSLNEQAKRYGGTNVDIKRTDGVFFEFKAFPSPAKPLFVVKKWVRKRGQAELMRVYFIVQGVIYPAPVSLYRLLSSQMHNSHFFFGQAVQLIQEDVYLNANSGYMSRSDVTQDMYAPSEVEGKGEEESSMLSSGLGSSQGFFEEVASRSGTNPMVQSLLKEHGSKAKQQQVGLMVSEKKKKEEEEKGEEKGEEKEEEEEGKEDKEEKGEEPKRKRQRT